MITFKKAGILISALIMIHLPIVALETSSQWVEHQIANVMHDYFGEQTNLQITPLTGGYSATSLLLRDTEKSYVLRLISHSEPPFRVNSELYAMQQAASVGIAPVIHWVGADGHAILMDYIDGETLNIERSKRTEVILKVAENMRKVHALEKNPFSAPSFEERMESFYAEYFQAPIDSSLWDSTSKPKEPDHSNIGKSALAIIREQSAKLQSLGSPLANIHGDLSPRNILDAGQEIYFIDWGESMYTEPLQDLGYYSILMDYNCHEEALLLRSYLQHEPTANENMRFLIAKKMNFARLALGTQCIGNMLSSIEGDQASQPLQLKEWSYYANILANSNDRLSAQFFWEFAQVALKSANSVLTK